MKDFFREQDPFKLFKNWFEESQIQTTFEPTKMTLATVSADGMPSARVVLLKKYDDNGFYFFTNYESQKAQELIKNKKAALVFHWEKPFHQQIRIKGLVEKVSYQESQKYFQSRDRGSQIGAWASPQSKVIHSRNDLIELYKESEEAFLNKEVPCPPHWGGFCLKPLNFEFWQSQDFRLHDRFKFERDSLSKPWKTFRLAP